MRVAVTGTPGTGKTTVTELVDADLEVVHLNDLVRETGLHEGRDDERGSLVVDLEAIESHLADRDDVLIESHLSHHLPVDRAVVLRCHPGELRERLLARDEHAGPVADPAADRPRSGADGPGVDRHESTTDGPKAGRAGSSTDAGGSETAPPDALDRSARENAEAEALDVVLSEAVDRHGLADVYEIDTTDRTPEAVAADVEAVLAGDRDPSAGDVDFIDYL